MSETSSAMTGSTAGTRPRISTLFISFGILITLLDQLSKGLVYRFLPVIDSSQYRYPYGGIGIFKNFSGIEFSINHMTNTGAAWGILGHYQLPLMIVRIALILGLCTYLFFYNRQISWQLPLIMVIAGALSNVLDYFIYGHVIDMFHLVIWGFDFPVFNLADSSITVAIAVLFFLSSKRK